jgi:glycogen debranching enzyme
MRDAERARAFLRRRPSDATYDRFVHLARAYRDGGYADDGRLGRSAFLVEDPLFNSIWLWSTHALVDAAALAGEDPGPYREAAAGIHSAILGRLWDAEQERFLPRDLCSGRAVDRRTVLSLAPLLDPDLPAPIARALRDELRSPRFHSAAGIGVATADLGGPDFDNRRYWRGPVWANLNWLLAKGMRAHGLAADADALDALTLRLAAGAGMHEYFDPLTGEGRGIDDFSWTAAVVVDILCSA